MKVKYRHKLIMMLKVCIVVTLGGEVVIRMGHKEGAGHKDMI